MNQPLAGQ